MLKLVVDFYEFRPFFVVRVSFDSRIYHTRLLSFCDLSIVWCRSNAPTRRFGHSICSCPQLNGGEVPAQLSYTVRLWA